MADDKKNIGPEAEKPGEVPQEKKAEPIKDTPPAPEQPAPGAPQAPVVEAAPKAQPAPTVESSPWKRRLPLRRCWISAPPKIRLRQRRKHHRRKSPSRSRRKKSPSVAVRRKQTRPLPIRQSRPNLGTKSPKASPSRRSLPWIRAALPLARRPRRSRLRPVTPPAPKKRKSFISTCLTCIRSKIIPLVSGTMRKCRGLWSRSRQQGVDQPTLVRPREDNGYFAPICYLFESFPCIRKKLCIT